MVGFEVLEADISYPNIDDLSILRAMKVAKFFVEKYPIKEIGVKHLYLVARKS